MTGSAAPGQASLGTSDTEIVRLPVPDGGEKAVRELLDGEPYLGQKGLQSHRVLYDTGASAVLLILEWASRDAADRAIRTPVGRRFLQRLMPLLAGSPQIGHYGPALGDGNPVYSRQMLASDSTVPFADAAAVVTGGAGGIGSAITEALVDRGALVATLDRTPGSGTLHVHCDASNPAEIAEAISAVHRELGPVRRLVCAAGSVSEHPLAELEPVEWHRVLDNSLTSAFLAARAVAPSMAEAGGGAIVTFSSGWATRGYRHGPHYAAAKAGVEALTKSLALELAPHGIRANSIAPGPIRTPMIDGLVDFDEPARARAIPLGRIGEPADVVGPALFLLGDDSRYVTGAVLHVNGGLLMP